jgi:hypothetical protein
MAADLSAQRKTVTPLLALVLSAAVLPGLGQLLTGRVLRGAIMAGALLLWLPVAIVKLGRDLMLVLPPLSAQAEAGEALSFAALQNALAPMADGLLMLFLPLISVWVWSLADSIQYFIQSRKG